MGHDWKSCDAEMRPRVRIPVSPPNNSHELRQHFGSWLLPYPNKKMGLIKLASDFIVQISPLLAVICVWISIATP